MARYVYPPRPKQTIPFSQLDEEEQRGVWLWQRKFDGDRCVTAVEGRQVYLSNRHGKWHSATKFPLLRKELAALDLSSGLHYLDGELLHPKVEQTLVLFDILQLTEYLIGVKQLARLDLLVNVCGHPEQLCPQGVALQVSDHVWLAEFGFSDFLSHFQEFCTDSCRTAMSSVGEKLVEGLVLRSKESSLDNWGSNEYEVDWQLRCRRKAQNYRF